MIYNLESNQWTISTFLFDQAIGFFSTANSDYSRFLVKGTDDDVYALSSEDETTPVPVHLLTRPIKINSPDIYKKINRIAVRCLLLGIDQNTAYNYNFGVWGKQDNNRYKEAIPLIAIQDDSYTDQNGTDLRNDIVVGTRKGKYKSLSLSFTGYLIPNSYIENFEIHTTNVEVNKMR